MKSRRSTVALRLAAEFSVIVAGVLVALFAESWWSERESRQFERELFADMLEEFQANISILESDLANNRTKVGYIDEVVAMPSDVLAGLSDDQISSLFEPARLVEFSGFDPAMGIARALVVSGDLAAVKDRELRLYLANWSALLDERERFTRNAAQLVLEIGRILSKARSDGEWSIAERLEVKFNVERVGYFVGLVVRNQNQLHSLAGEIVKLLESRH